MPIAVAHTDLARVTRRAIVTGGRPLRDCTLVLEKAACQAINPGTINEILSGQVFRQMRVSFLQCSAGFVQSPWPNRGKIGYKRPVILEFALYQSKFSGGYRSVPNLMGTPFLM